MPQVSLEDLVAQSLDDSGGLDWSRLKRLRNSCDIDADVVLTALQRRSDSACHSFSPPRQGDLLEELREGSQTDPVLHQFWSNRRKVPDWVDWAQLERGQRVFHRYILASITGFVLQGFVAENSSASGVFEVLTRTGGFHPKNLSRRLQDTFRWLLEVTSDLRSIQPGGKGHADTIRVRLLHAQVRQRILKLTEQRPSYYDKGRHGLPINTHDSVHSISTFCCSPMWSELPKVGVKPTQQEIQDYVALFRYLGHLLGVPHVLFDSADRAKAVLHAMTVHESQPSVQSRKIAQNFIETITSIEPCTLSAGFVAAGSRCMNGDALCDTLGIPHATSIHYATFRGCCWLASALCFLQRRSCATDSFLISVR